MRATCLTLALLAAAPAGCVEDPKAAAAKPDGAADKPAAAPAAPPPPPRADRPPAAPDDTDPVVAAAQISAAQVANHEERIDAALTELSGDLQALSGKDHRAVDLTAERLLAVVQLLRASGERLLERYPKVKADLAGIVKAGANVKVGYGRAKELYREKAGLEDGDLKDRYLALAVLCDAFVRTNAGRTAQYAAFAADLDQAVAKVGRHVQFLADFEGFLKLNPATSGAKGRDDFMATLNAFADQILRFGDVLRQFRDTVRGGAVSQKLRAEHDRAVAARRQPESAATPAAPPAVAATAAEAPETATAPEVVAASPPAPAPAVRYVPVSVTRCVPALVPVVYYHHGRCGCGRYTTAVTRYEWRTRLVTETHYAPVGG